LGHVLPVFRLDEQLRREDVDIHDLEKALEVPASTIASWAKGDPRNSPMAPTDGQCEELAKKLGLAADHFNAPAVVTIDQPTHAATALAALEEIVRDLDGEFDEALGALPGGYRVETEDPEGTKKTIRGRLREATGRDIELTIRTS
jgi:hypothetical protein